MENFFTVNTASELNKIFENAGDKLVVLMFYSKHIPDCRHAKSGLEKSALNHTLSYFCIVDMDKFKGESRYANNIQNMPRFDFYYMGNTIGTYSTSNEREIEQYVRSGEQYAMNQNNMKNGMGNQNSGQATMGQMPQINPAQIQQQIMNNAMMQNPAYAQQLMQNPWMMQQLVQRQIQAMQQQQMMQNQYMMGQMNQANQMPGTNMMQNNSNMQQNALPAQTMSQLASTMGADNPAMGAIPTIQQMQQMFQIFQMMQQMGLLNTAGKANDAQNAPNPQPAKKEPDAEPDGAITCPNGDKIIPLPGGKFGLIKNNHA